MFLPPWHFFSSASSYMLRWRSACIKMIVWNIWQTMLTPIGPCTGLAKSPNLRGKKMAIGKVEDENSNIFTSFPWLHGSTVARIFRRAPSMDLGVHWLTHLWMCIMEYNARKCTPKYWKKVNSSTNEIEVKLRSDIQFQNGLFQVPCFYPPLKFFFVFELRHASMEVGIPFQVHSQYWNNDLNACRPPPKQKWILW